MCQDALYIEHKVDNIRYETMRVVNDVMPLILLGKQEMTMVLEPCVYETFREHDGFLLDLTLTGKNKLYNINIHGQYYC